MSSPPPGPGKFHFVVVARAGADTAIPVRRSFQAQDEFLTQPYMELVKARAGWCFLFVDGQVAQLCGPVQSFHVVLPDGAVVHAASGTPTLSADGSFRVLEPVE